MRKTYWKGIEQLRNDSDFVKYANKEFPADLTIKDAYGDNTDGNESGTKRRDFLKLMGFSLAAVSLAACETPVKKAIPFLNKPEEIDPGIPNYYASTYTQDGEYCSILVKTREGRPIFIEGNTYSPITKGGTNARINAAVVSLYDIEKSKGPSKAGQEIDWAVLDKEVKDQLGKLAVANLPIAIVAHSIMSPTTKKVINDFKVRYPSAVLVSYDQLSVSGILDAHKLQYGKRVLPTYRFEQAKAIVSIGADFLNAWISGVEHSVGYATNRKVGKEKKEMSVHFQFESMLTITGSSADYRTPIKASQEALVVAKLYNLVAKATGNALLSGVEDVDVAHLGKAAESLLANKGKSLVLAASNNVHVQVLVNMINEMLGNYGTTLDINAPSFVKQGNDAAFASFVDQLEKGQIGGVVFYNTNPVYDTAFGERIAASIGKAKLSIATGDRLDETASLCGYHAPDCHFLESWGDAEPIKGHFSLTQPAISKIYNTRQFEDSLLVWAESAKDYYTYLKESWQTLYFPLSQTEDFEKMWQQALHDGVFSVVQGADVAYTSLHEEGTAYTQEVPELSAITAEVKKVGRANNDQFELLAFAGGVMGSGLQSNNPILQETPDPITKVCWGNYVAISQAAARELGLDQRFETRVPVAEISANGFSMKLPVVVQPGLEKKTIAVPFGYGRDAQKAGKVAAEAAGENAYRILQAAGGFSYAIFDGVNIKNTGETVDIAQTQTHETIMARETIIQEATLSEYKKDDMAGRYQPKITTYSGHEKPRDISMWDINKDGFGKDEHGTTKKEENPVIWTDKFEKTIDIHKYKNHHWALNIDLNTCTGCAACVVACHVENNVPVVGKAEVVRRREMHWLRIDRYYSNPVGAESLKELEMAAENPEVVFQPMMCQHCNNAPCETVCPVAATTHSSEGLNQMTYNRCVGTKYCANNCPYKVRRFNWFQYFQNAEFDYYMNNDLGRMVLNPDVTVRSRGVMEKCSMCVQRIQAGKLKAKREGRRTQDGDVTTACASACPTNAITFGDLNDPNSKMRKLMDKEIEGRAYHVLEELNVSPNVWYMTKIRNKDNEA